jgi:DNA-binding SARP family transcriptional activator
MRDRISHMARAVGAAAALAGLVVGVPIGLAAVAGWPLPHGLPTVSAVRRALEDGWSPDGMVVIKAVAVVCWVAWAEVAACTAVEVATVLSGRHRSPKVPLAGPLQPLVARLVAALLVANVIVGVRTAAARPPSLAAAVAEYRPTPTAFTLVSAATQPPVALVEPAHAAPARASKQVVVHPRDDLWDLAEHHLGDPLRWREIWELNRDRLQPDGRRFTNPDLIRPGWILDLPADAVDGQEAPVVETRGESADRAASVDPGSPAGPPGAAPATPIAGAGPRPGGPPTAAEGSPSDRQRHPSGPRVSVELPSGSIVAASFAAGVAAAVATGRLRRRRAYRPSPPAPAVLDRDPDLGPTAQILLRALPPPTPRQTTVCDQLPPFPLRGLHDPAPGLVAVGTRGTEAVELDICVLGGLAVAGRGAPDVVRALIAALLAKGGPYVTELVITRAAADELLPSLGTVAGVRVTTDLDSALTEVEVELVRRTRLLEADDVRDFAAYRQGPGDLLPAVVLVAGEPGRHGARLKAVCELGRGLGVGAIGCGSGEGFVAQVHVDETGTATEVAPQTLAAELEGACLYRMAEHEVADVLGVVAAAREEAPEPMETAPVDHAEAETSCDVGDDGAVRVPAAGAQVQVRLLGPYRISVEGDEIRKGLRSSARELLAYFLLRPQGATLEAAVDALWPDADQQTGSDRFWTALGNLRSRIRGATGAEHPLIERDGEVYRVEDGVFDVDVWRCQAALADARRSSDDGALVEALERAAASYGGEPLEGCYYQWAEPAREELRRRALDALVRLAELRAGRGDREGALAAIEQAIGVDPYAEGLYRRAITLLGQLDRGDVARQLFRQLAARLQDLDVDPEDRTLAVLDAVSSSDGARRRRASPVLN